MLVKVKLHEWQLERLGDAFMSKNENPDVYILRSTFQKDEQDKQVSNWILARI